MILFINSSGQLVLGRITDLDTKKEMPVPQNFLKNLFNKGSLVCHTESDKFDGIVLLPKGPLLISSQPILTSEGKGPVKGTIIMGRYLDSELARLIETTNLPLVIHRINDSTMPSDFAAAQSFILGESPTLIKPLSEKSIAGYALIRDVYGYPALILRIDMPRDIYQQGRATVYYFALFIVLIGLIFAAAIIILLDKTFLSKMAQLSLDVRNIGLSGDVSTRIPIAGKDEISSLAGIINNMLGRIDQSEKELQKAKDELDIRVKERTVELETRNAEMERFIYTVSHELRSPLISSSGFAGLLRQDLEKGDVKRTEADLRLIEGAMTKMDQILGETLELSRIGRVANPPEDVPLDAIAKDALYQEAEKLKSRGVEVSVADDLPTVHVDRMRITEVLVNLIENSIKYMGDQAHPKIEIGHRKDKEETIFFVRDNGVGIDPSQHEKVFGLFYRLDPKSEGTGVGLTIVKRIIEVHGGRILIESELGKGCTVCFTLPLANVG
jgi:signal transduction histidine kinase